VALAADGSLLSWRPIEGILRAHDPLSLAVRWEYRWPRRVGLRNFERSAGGELAVGGFDPVLRILDERDGRELAALTHGEDVFAAAWSPTGELATGTNAGRVTRWRADGVRLATSDLGERVEDLAFSSDGSLVLANGVTRVGAWDEDGEPFPLPPTDGPHGAAMARDAPVLVTLHGGRPRTWHLPDLAPGPELARPSTAPVGIGISADGRQVTASMPYGAIAWDRASGALLGLAGNSEASPGFGTGIGTGQGWLLRRGTVDEAWLRKVSALNGFAVCRDTWEVVPVEDPGVIWAPDTDCGRGRR
jgi:hypothetical protein